VVATGTPEEIAALDDNYTGRYLREVLGDRARANANGMGSAAVARGEG
jgi:hypothetical protein